MHPTTYSSPSVCARGLVLQACLHYLLQSDTSLRFQPHALDSLCPVRPLNPSNIQALSAWPPWHRCSLFRIFILWCWTYSLSFGNWKHGVKSPGSPVLHGAIFLYNTLVQGLTLQCLAGKDCLNSEFCPETKHWSHGPGQEITNADLYPQVSILHTVSWVAYSVL